MNPVLTVACYILISLPSLSNGEDLRVTILTDPPLSGLICVEHNVTFTCQVDNDVKVKYYIWSVGGHSSRTGERTHTVEVSSLSDFNVTCEVIAKVKNNTVFGNSSVVVQPRGKRPQIVFQDVYKNYVIKMTGGPFNLSAVVMSDSNLTALNWSSPGNYGPPPNKTLIVHHGNMTTAILMVLKDVSVGDSGNYTLTAVNECGPNSSEVYVDVYKDCPYPRLVTFEPAHLTAVEGYNTSLVKCHFLGKLPTLTPQYNIQMYAKFPYMKKPAWLGTTSRDHCWVQQESGCPSGSDINHCCSFDLVLHSTPQLNQSGTLFYCDGDYNLDGDFNGNGTISMDVIPSPKVLWAPESLNTTVGSKAAFTCQFEASTNGSIAQIHWEFNGADLAGCRRYKKLINCSVNQSSTDTNYITSTLEIYSVQANNAGRFTCYCSYDTVILNVDAEIIESDHKSAMLSIKPDSSSPSSLPYVLYIIIIAAVILLLTVTISVGTVIYRYCKRRYSSRDNYTPLRGYPESGDEDEIVSAQLKDETLDGYIVEELFPYWEKVGKALHMKQDFLEEIYEELPSDPAERLKIILRKWRDTSHHPSVATLNHILKQLGLKRLIPENRTSPKEHHIASDTRCDDQLPVRGPGPQIFINKCSRILPGINNNCREVNAFRGTLRSGFPSCIHLNSDLKQAWEEFGIGMGVQILDLQRITLECSSQTVDCCLAVCVDWLNNNMEATWNEFLLQLQQPKLQQNNIASGLYQYLNSLVIETDRHPSKKKNKMELILEKHYQAIVEHVDPPQLLVQLKAHGLVTKNEEHMLMNYNTPPQTRTMQYLQGICSKHPDSMVLFYQCLKKETEHLGHQHLATIMEPDIRQYESQSQSMAARNGNRSRDTLSESDIDSISQTIKYCWAQVADELSVSQDTFVEDTVRRISTSLQDPEEQARSFLQCYAQYTRSHAKENIIRALDQLGIDCIINVR